MNVLIALLSGTGIFNSLFFIIYINFFSKDNYPLPGKKLLSFLILVVAIKMGFLWVMDLTQEYPTIQYYYFLISLVSYTCIGPLFFLYVQSLNGKNFSLKSVFHLIPPMLLLLLFDMETYVRIQGIWYIQVYFILYVTLAGFQIWRYSQQNDHKDKNTLKWLLIICVILFVVWLTAVNELYKIELVALYALLLYPLMIVTSTLKSYKKKEGKTIIKKGADEDLLRQIIHLMEAEKAYLDANLNMPELAKKLHIPLHRLSATINNHLNKNFSDFVNEFRVVEASKMLTNPDCQHLTISSIAYDAGFNSLSTFNKAFKKKFDTTPSQYRKSFV